MNELLKKYLLIKWWFPILLFGISLFLFINDIILPSNDFGFLTLIFAGLILLISSIWQLFKGKKIIGLLQFFILVIPTLLFGIMIYIFAGIMDKPDSKLALENIEPLIKEKTDLVIPKEYEILKNLIEHTEGALDSDYSIELKIKYKQTEEKYITQQILNKLNFKSEKGIWKYYENGFDFKCSESENNRNEPFYFKVDTLSNKIEFNLFHL